MDVVFDWNNDLYNDKKYNDNLKKVSNDMKKEFDSEPVYSKKMTHMWRRWGTAQDFFLAFIAELEKQLFIQKKLLKYGNKKQNNFNITMLLFF